MKLPHPDLHKDPHEAMAKLFDERMELAYQQFQREVVEPYWRKIMEEGNSEGLLNLLS